MIRRQISVPSESKSNNAVVNVIHIAFVIHSLARGGAQRQLIELVRGLSKQQFRISVITLYDGGAFAGELANVPGIQLYSLAKQGRRDIFGFLWRAWILLRRLRPDILHGYMNVANELCLLMGRAVGARVVWGLRASNMALEHYDWAAALAFTVGARLSRFVDAIIANSHAGKSYHTLNGYTPTRMRVIPNGIDTDRFRPDPQARRQIRMAWGLSDKETAIGIIARLDPMKDYPTFLRAAALLARAHPQARFVCVGDGPPDYTRELQALAEQLGLDANVLWVGAQDDMLAIYNGLDIATSSSAFGEGFSNAIAEAAACGVLCVATDVGDSAIIVQEAAQIIPPGNPDALAAAWSSMLTYGDETRTMIATRARARIVAQYSTKALIERTALLLRQIA